MRRWGATGVMILIMKAYAFRGRGAGGVVSKGLCILAAKRQGKAKSSPCKKARQLNLNIHRNGAATNLARSTLRVGSVEIEEDHRHEQFFFDSLTTARICRMAMRFEKPALVGMPSVAVAFDQIGRDCLFLDRDDRFAKLLNTFVHYDLHRPRPLLDTDVDAIFADPPFANVSPTEFASALQLIAPRPLPLFVCYPMKRHAQLAAAIGVHNLTHIEPALGYATGHMPNKVALFAANPSDLSVYQWS